ncbi:MAG: hypothetical protein WCP62_17500 [Planctomycetota bacterium]
MHSRIFGLMHSFVTDKVNPIADVVLGETVLVLVLVLDGCLKRGDASH